MSDNTSSDHNPSRIVTSNQAGVHEHLAALVNRHLTNPFRKPIARHNIDSFHSALDQINRDHIIFDSGCGNGNSTVNFAMQHPEAFVIGIDKSSARLEKNRFYEYGQDIHNYCLVRADLIDFLQLANRAGLKLYKHYFLYPNPWPKKKHLQRRWHGSAVFRDIVALGGSIELRSNWQIYVKEFSAALAIAGFNSRMQALSVEKQGYLSDFEAKYHRSGQRLWQLTAALNIDSQ